MNKFILFILAFSTLVSCVPTLKEKEGTCQSGQSETRTMYEKESVPSNEICISEIQTRVCTNKSLGEWSRNFEYSKCEVLPSMNCNSFQSLQQETRIRYLNASVSYGETCIQEVQSRTCYKGVFSDWSGSYQEESCNVQQTASCSNTPSGGQESRSRYLEAYPAQGQNCISENQTRTCSNGVFSNWSGSYQEELCNDQQAANCGNTPSGGQESRSRFLDASVGQGQNCISENQTRTCSNGVFSDWSGSYQEESCNIIVDPSTQRPTAKEINEIKFETKTKENGLGSSTINSLFVDSAGVVYAGTSGGLSISNNNGNSFINRDRKNNNLIWNTIKDVFVDHNGNIYVTTHIGLSISSNGGVTFINKTTDDGLLGEWCLTVFVDKNGVVYVGHRKSSGSPYSGISISTNGGATFKSAPGLGNDDGDVRDIFVDDLGVIYAATTKGVHISSDGGLTFVKSFVNNHNTSKILVDKDGVIYAATEYDGLFISKDNGKSYTEIGSKNNLDGILTGVFVDDAGTIYISDFGGVSISVDGGETFIIINEEAGVARLVYDVFVDNTGKIYTATAYGLSISK